MSTAELPTATGDQRDLVLPEVWWRLPKMTYQVRVLLCPEEGGGFSAHALRLPGVVSQGETEAEAIINIRDAFRGVVAEYRESGTDIPWEDVNVDECPKGAKERWILVNA